ncbi:hypothetical protein D9M69_544420 [compost metagenome]
MKFIQLLGCYEVNNGIVIFKIYTASLQRCTDGLGGQHHIEIKISVRCDFVGYPE